MSQKTNPKAPAQTASKPATTETAVARAKAAQQKAVAALRPPALAEGSVLQSLYGTMAGLIMIAALLVFVFSSERADIMFAANSDGQLTALQAMDYPNTSSEAVINWSKMAVGEIFTYNFNNIVDRMSNARRYFTPLGWESFRNAFQQQSILAQTQAQRQFVTTLPSGAAVISEEGEVKGRYYWTVQLETITSIYAGNTVINNGALALKVERIQTRNSGAGYPFGLVQITPR